MLAYFYSCLRCNLVFPALEPQSACPGCQGEVELQATRSLAPEIQGSRQEVLPPRRVVLDNLRSAWNVGAVFRTAEAAGFQHIHLCGITPTPPHPGIAKTALGAEQALLWSYHPNVLELVHHLRNQGWQLWALETSGQPWTPGEPAPDHPLVLVIGNERTGVHPWVLQACHRVVSIPMRGRKRSLNVAVAFGVVAFWSVGGWREEHRR